MSKRTLIVLFALFAVVFGACNFNVNLDVERGSGNVVRETRDVSGFDRLSLAGIGDVILTQGSEESLEIEAEDNILRKITTEVRDGTLYIGYTQRALLPTKDIKFYLTMQDISGLEILGISNIRSDEIDTDRLDINISGSGNIEIRTLTAEYLNVNLSGAGNFNAEGKVSEQKANLSGVGNYEVEDLESENATIILAGLGRAVVWVNDSLDVSISGTGSVEYYGSPRVTRNISGLGSVSSRGKK